MARGFVGGVEKPVGGHWEELSAQRAAQLRAEITAGGVEAPGAFNALAARAIEKKRFRAAYLSGAAVSNCVVGVPDTGLITLDDVVIHAGYVARATSLPLIADIDTGFGGPDEAAETVRRMAAAGVSAVHMEDQRIPKKCGHLPGKELIETEEMEEKLRAAAAAKPHPDFLLLARTDARAVESFEDAVKRAQRYLEAGADGIFPEALQSVEEFEQFAKEVPTILLANMTEFGKSPNIPAPQLHAMGYGIVIYPMSLVRIAKKAVNDLLDIIKLDGSTQGALERMQTRKELYELLDYDPNK